MPLKAGTSKRTISKNIAELHKGPQFKRTQKKFSKKKARAQAIAIAYRKAGKSRRKK